MYYFGNEVDAVLVINKGDLLPVDALLVVLLLLELEDVLVKVELELLVGVVDAKLLKRVFHKVLETKDVEHTDEGVLAPLADRVVDRAQNERKHAAVKGLGESVLAVLGLW